MPKSRACGLPPTLGSRSLTSIVIAIRGDRLALCRSRAATSGPETFHAEMLRIVEIDADNRIATRIVFDLEEIDAAFEELDARYLSGEAAQSRTWSVIAENYAGLNRHEVPATTPDWVNVDRRHVTTMAPGDMIANLRAAWDLSSKSSIYIEAVHQLTDLGAVVTHAMSGTSQEGFQAEWRMVDLLTSKATR